MNNAVAATMLSGVFRQYSRRTCPAIRARACPKTLAYCEVVLRATNERLGKLKIAKLFFLFLAAFSPHTTTSRNVNGFQTCSRLLLTEVIVVAALVFLQTAHLFLYSDLYASEKTQKTISYLSSAYPEGTIGVINVPQVASLIPSSRTYQYLSTYGLWEFGARVLFLPEEQLPVAVVTESQEQGLSGTEKDLLHESYDEDTAFMEGFTVYRKK